MQQRLTGIFNRRHKDCDGGFSLVELVVAMFIIGGVLLSLITLQTKAMVSIAQAKERQQATAIANEVLEQLRALPWNSIIKGPASYDTKFVSGNRVTIPGEPIEDEILVRRNPAGTPVDISAKGSPLDGVSGTNLTIHTDPALPGFEFRAYSFVTRPDGPEDLYNIIVVVEWEPRGKTEARRVVAKTTAFNTRSGCGTGSTRPYASACQDFFVAEGSASSPSFTITGEDVVAEDEVPGPGPHAILPGSDVSQISVSGASVGISIDSSQSTMVRTSASTGSITIYDMDRSETVTPGTIVSVTASDSVSSGDESNDSGPLLGTELKPDPISGDGLKLTIDGGRRAGNVQSNTDAVCDSWAIAEHPCGSAEVSNDPQKVMLTIDEEPPITLMSIEVTRPSVQAARYPGGTVLSTGAKYCKNLTGSGCIEATASIDNYDASFPGVVDISSHELLSEAGRGFYESLRDENVSNEYDPGVQFSSGETLSLNSIQPKEYRPDEPLDPIFVSGDTIVTAEPRISFEPVHKHVENSDPECQSEACTGRGTVAAVNVQITYTVLHEGESTAFSLIASLGDTRASATYKAAQEAWGDDA